MKGSAASSAASCCASRPRPPRVRAARGDRSASSTVLAEACARGRAGIARTDAAVRGDRHGPPRRRRAVVRVRHRRAVRVRRRERRRLPRRRADRRRSSCKEIGATTAEGQTFRIDARLRPEGNQGPLARSIDGFRAYYEQWGLTVGAPGAHQGPVRRRRRRRSAGASARSPSEFVYGRPMTEDDVREIRRMKARIERERIPPGEDPQFHLKLGPRLAVGRRVHRAAAPARPRRRASRASGYRARSTRWPACAHGGLARRRGRRRARGVVPVLRAGAERSLPADRPAVRRASRRPRRARASRAAARLRAPPNITLRDDYRRVTRRARRVVERVFYGT